MGVVGEWVIEHSQHLSARACHILNTSEHKFFFFNLLSMWWIIEQQS